MRSDDESAGREHLLRWRARVLQPLVSSGGTVLEYLPRNELNLAAVTAATKIAVSDRKRPLLPRDVHLTSNFDSLTPIDLAICDHVLEFLTDPVKPLDDLKIALRPGGHILVETLYDPGFRDRNRPAISKPNHFYSWNVQTLGNLLVDRGYEFQSGTVERCPNEKLLCRWAPRIGLGAAAFLAHVFASEREVRVLAIGR